MRLSEFVRDEHDRIVSQWVEFARTLLPWATGRTTEELRDHAKQLLEAIVVDMESRQTKREKDEKSKGHGGSPRLADVGREHALQRLKTGFTLDQLVAEYRALRASVLRMWEASNGDEQNDVTRFNESIDETLTEAAVGYANELDRTRELFLGVLGHDLRNPIGAITLGAEKLVRSKSLSPADARSAARVLSSAQRVSRMVSDLLDFTRARLGGEIPVVPAPTNLASAAADVVAELRLLHPAQELRLETSGDLSGEWDRDRMAQVLSNLVSNAVEHGGAGPVTLFVGGDPNAVQIAVHNTGRPIPERALERIFEPGAREPSERKQDGLGLGLFIARQVVVAHGGTISVASTEEDGTTFTVTLPRLPHAQPLALAPAVP